MDIQTAECLAEVFANKGGFTAEPNTGKEVSTGYSVSLPGYEYKMPLSSPHQSIPHFIQAYVNYHEQELAQRPGLFVGAWLDKGIMYMDISEVVFDRELAESLARQRDQKALYNHNKQKVQFVDDTFIC